MKGLYIHIPFCIKKCEYCDFVSFPKCDNYFESYVNALTNEMKKYRGTHIDTVFIGGGTPSVLPPYLIGKICNAVKDNFVLHDNYEWTIEVNPGTVTDEKINQMLRGEINRISVGVQSFNDCELAAAGRIHNGKTAYDTVISLSKAGFKNISVDLMESLPNQTKESFKKSLGIAVSLPITHISVYSLIIEEGTPIKEKYDMGIYELPDEDLDRDLYKFTKDFLEKHGFCRYEISNYAKDSYESKHNLKYWNCDEYIGVGVAAHSYLDSVRYYNTSSLEDYINGATVIGKDCLSESDKQGEFMMLGLRKTKGVNKKDFFKRFKCMPGDIWGNVTARFIADGFMTETEEYYALTEKGTDVSNSIMCEFL